MIRRTYSCPNCDRQFTYECNSDDPDPPCPNSDCDKVLEWRPQSFAIGGSVEGKAAAYTYKALEEDYGLSNFKDNAKPGESGIVARHETKVEAEKVEREFRDMAAQTNNFKEAQKQFWGDNSGASPQMNNVTGQQMIQMAKAMNAADPRPDPISLLHSQAKRGGRKTSDLVSEGYRTDFHNPARKA
jgi:hypothetical protein